MKSKDQILLEEAYKSIYTHVPNISDLIQRDILTIKELVEEGFFGDLADKAKGFWNKTKQAVSNITGKITDKLAQILVTTIFSKLQKGEKEKVLEIIASGKLPQEGITAAKQALSSNEQQQESYENNKHFIAHLLFTEENIKQALTE